MKITSFLVFFFALIFSLQAAPSIIWQYDFSQNKGKWKLPGSGYRILNKLGRNKSKTLQCERTNPKTYVLAYRKLELPAGQKYKLTLWIKSENVISKTGKGRGATFAIEWYKNDKWLNGFYAQGLTGNRGWTKFTMPFSMSKEADSCRLILYLDKNFTGKAYYDDITVESSSINLSIAAPASHIIFAEKPQIKLSAKQLSGPQFKLEAQLSGKSSQKATAVISNGAALLNFKPVQPGSYQLQVVLKENNKVKQKRSFKLKALTLSQRSASNGCFIAVDGRAEINGKPFMPIGIYTQKVTKKNLPVILKAGFNCSMPYGSFSLAPTEKLGKDKLKAIRKLLDYCQSENFKIIFNLKDVYKGTEWEMLNWNGLNGEVPIVKAIVNGLKTHPALLGYYINDELPLSLLAKIKERKKLINELDPFHPTWTVLANVVTIPFFSSATDVMGIDPYPVGKSSKPDITQLLDEVKTVVACNKPHWPVIQCFSHRGYTKKFPDARIPSSEEITSMALLYAIYGAKGFFFYSYFDLAPERSGQKFSKSLQDITSATQLLNKLEPFIMSKVPVKQMQIKETSGRGAAGYFVTDNGEKCVIVVAATPGVNKFQFSLSGNYVSTNKLTRRGSSENYIFSSNNINFDILYER